MHFYIYMYIYFSFILSFCAFLIYYLPFSPHLLPTSWLASVDILALFPSLF